MLAMSPESTYEERMPAIKVLANPWNMIDNRSYKVGNNTLEILGVSTIV